MQREMRVVLLPENVSATMVADVSREAMLALIRGAGKGWDKRELAQWLAGPYRLMTSYASAPPGEAAPAVAGPAALAPAATRGAAHARARSATPRARAVSAARLHDVVAAAKEEVLATLLMAAPPDSDVRFAERSIARGHVVRTRDRAGRGGWAPVNATGMLLAERILSLVSVDYLMRPADYLALLSVCGRCEAVSFDAQVRVKGHCPQHRRSSRKIRLSP
jgi:hypothetical protein